MTAGLPAELEAAELQPQPMPPLGRGIVLVSGSVSFSRTLNASVPDSSSSGCDGVGTMNPKSSAWLLDVAWRMKCCDLVAASQTMMTVWSALTTGLPDGGAGQHAGAGSAMIPAAR